MSTISRAVFLSYASEDAPAAQRIAEALRSAGIEVWFDREELRGGDAWDQKIRQQIRDCQLFIPIISAHTEARLEGYFRREWKLAVDRTDDMAGKLTFLVPVVIDDTPNVTAEVPERFRQIQWTRLRGGEATRAFVGLINQLLTRASPTTQASRSVQTPSNCTTPAPELAFGGPQRWSGRQMAMAIGACAAVVAALSYFAYSRFHIPSAPVATTAAPRTVAANEKSLAVLPFLDMSEKHDRGFFADGLAEELIDRLARETNLKVIARTSSFQFRDKTEDSGLISTRLGVAYLVEGSVRAVGERLRISVQLIRGSDGANVWSETFDRTAGDLFRVQDEIAESVARQLSVSIAPHQKGNVRSDSPGYILLLQATSVMHSEGTRADVETAIGLTEQATKLDPKLAQAWALRSMWRTALITDYPSAAPRDSTYSTARDEAKQALQLDPDLPEGHIALARVFMQFDHNWKEAEQEISAALIQGAGSADVQRNAYYLSTVLGHWEEAVSQIRRAVDLDPLNYNNYLWLGNALAYARQYAASEAAFQTAISLKPDADYLRANYAFTLRLEGKWDEALSEAEREPLEVSRLQTLAELLYLRDRRNEADRLVSDLRSKYARDFPFFLGEVYAVRQDLDNAFMWWERAVLEHDSQARWLLTETTDPALQLATSDRRFKALLRKMNLPD